MTKQQEIQLKNGDEVFVKAVFEGLASDGDAYARYFWTNARGARDSGLIAVSFDSVLRRSCLQQLAEKPKYEPCRLFKKGDKVRVVERNGRKFWNAAPETIYTVVADEYLHDDPNVLLRGCVGLNDGKPATLSAWNIPFFHIELVTPVEELEPYFVMELKGGYGVYNTRFQPETEACHYWNEMHPHAKEAAEAECARLNAEHRKEQSNG